MPNTTQRTIEAQRTKPGRDRDVKMPDPLVVVLAELVRIILEEEGRADVA